MTDSSGASNCPARHTDSSGGRLPTRRVFIVRALGAGAVLAGFGAATSSGGGATALVPVSVDVAPRAAAAPLSDPAWVARHDLTAAQYQAEFDRLVSEGYRLVDVCGYEDASREMYAAIWEKSDGPAWVARHGLTAANYQTEFNRLTAGGYRPVRVSTYAIGTDVRYAAIWNKSGGSPWVARHGLRSAAYQAEFDQLAKKGYRPVQVSAGGGAIQPLFAAIWEKRQFSQKELTDMANVVGAFMKTWSVPGVSVAIAQQGRLVYAQGFGQADKSSGAKVTTASLFRIASLAKPITSVAVMKLVEGGKLKLTDTVFGRSGILGTTYGTQPYKTNIDKITVQHLLEHTAGGWPNDGNDPMFTNPAFDQAKLISWVLDNRPLNSIPGRNWAYSNFGYCVLGRVIEKVTGKRYDAYVQESVLKPCGITTMTTASTAMPVPSGGAGYAKGWYIHSNGNWWHNGSLPGTSSFLVRGANGFCLAALINTRAGNQPPQALDNMMWDMQRKVDVWPTYDLF